MTYAQSGGGSCADNSFALAISFLVSGCCAPAETENVDRAASRRIPHEVRKFTASAYLIDHI